MTTYFRALTPIEFVDPEIPNMQVGDTAIYNHADEGLRLILERGMIELLEKPRETLVIEPEASAEEVFDLPEVVESDDEPAVAKPVAKKTPAKKAVAKKATAKKTVSKS